MLQAHHCAQEHRSELSNSSKSLSGPADTLTERTSLIVRKGGEAYLRGVTVVFRLLALAALMLMPFGMGLGIATAAPATHAEMGSAEEGHCDGSAGAAKGKPAMGLHCGAACAGLPADPRDAAPAIAAAEPMLLAEVVQVFAGTIPPPATPPPKLG